MRNYVIINGVNSLTIQGLAIKTLPPITKPIQRNLREEIDGRDGDIVTPLGYGAYDKTIEIGLFGTFDIDEVIAYFNQKGTITFSNEADKVYYFQALEQVDYAELLKFRTANVVLHCQPFKYPTEETPLVEEYEYVEATGSNVTLDNTSEAIFNKIDLLGNTEQTQYTGKNKLPTATTISTTGTTSHGITFTRLEDGTIKANGTATAGVSIYLNNDWNVMPTGTYTLGDGIASGQDGTTFFLYADVQHSDGTAWDAKNFSTVTPTTRTRIMEEAFRYKPRIVVRQGITLNNIIFKPQLEASSSATDYEPYVGGIPSPNPNYPQDIHVVSGENSITITGRNLSKVSNGNNLTLTGILQPGNYVFSMDYTTAVGYNLKAGAGGETIATASPDGAGRNRRTFTITTPTKLYLNGYSRTTGVAFADATSKFQVEVGTTATEYEPYTSQTFPINLGDLEMASIPNTTYKDVFVKEADKWYKREAVGKTIMNGTEADNQYSIGTSGGVQRVATNLFVDTILPYTDTNRHIDRIICSHFKGRTTDAVGSMYQYQRQVLFDTTSDITSVALWKTWLTTHNLEVRYVKKETEDIEITNETLADQLEAIKNAISYKGQTNISQTNNDMPFILDLSALKENSDHLVIDNIGNIYSKPTLDLEGTGIVDIYLNDTQMFEVDLSEKNEIVIDTEKMEAYNPTDNTLANRQVTGDYSKFKLDSGENDLRFSGDLTKATITNYERWL